jgi:hypothetical protein
MTRDSELAPRVYRQPEHLPGSDQSVSGVMPPVFGQLIAQTWTEMEEARHRYNQDAKRLRYWQWWFVGMFTFYTTLVGILLLNLLTGS